MRIITFCTYYYTISIYCTIIQYLFMLLNKKDIHFICIDSLHTNIYRDRKL